MPTAKLGAMPLEGHYNRVNTPLRKLTRREIAVLAAGLAITLIAVLALLFVPGSTERPLAPGANCIEVGVAGRVGNEPVVGCGAKAEAICARAAGFDDARAHTIVAACREEGIEF